MQTVELSGKTVDEALKKALLDLGGLTREQVEVEVISEGSRGFLGFLGSKDAVVRVTVKETREEKAKNFVKKLLQKMQIEAEVYITEVNDKTIYLDVEGNGLGSLIGRRGQTLDSLQYLTNLIVNKGEEERRRIILDISGYRKKREENLYNLALHLAERVKEKGESITLEPMNAHERRIVHLALQNHPFVYTQSCGEDPDRKIVICLKKVKPSM